MNKEQVLIYKLLNDNDIALFPHNPTPTQDLIELFDHFKSIPTPDLYKKLIMNHSSAEWDKFQLALNTIKHYKGEFDDFDAGIDFETYQKLKYWFSVNIRKKFEEHYYEEIVEMVLNDKKNTIDIHTLQVVLKKNTSLYIKIAKKLTIENAINNIFAADQFKVFDWLNTCNNTYDELKKLNNPNFILKNMNNRLDSNDGTLKYILENVEPNKDLFVSIKKNIGIKKFIEISNGKINKELIPYLIENLDDLIIIINNPQIEMSTVELILKTTKESFPNIYESLNSLLFVKKEFNNK
jgi:hypothetical protein